MYFHLISLNLINLSNRLNHHRYFFSHFVLFYVHEISSIFIYSQLAVPISVGGAHFLSPSCLCTMWPLARYIKAVIEVYLEDKFKIFICRAAETQSARDSLFHF